MKHLVLVGYSIYVEQTEEQKWFIYLWQKKCSNIILSYDLKTHLMNIYLINQNQNWHQFKLMKVPKTIWKSYPAVYKIHCSKEAKVWSKCSSAPSGSFLLMGLTFEPEESTEISSVMKLELFALTERVSSNWRIANYPTYS